MLERGDCYAKDSTWCIICEVGVTDTIWRVAHEQRRLSSPSAALEFFLEAEGWIKIPYKVSPDFVASGTVVTNCW